MDKLSKWIILSQGVSGKKALDRLSREYEEIGDSDPRLNTPEARAVLKLLETPPEGASALAYPDAAYPAKLRQLKNPPSVLYVRGNAQCLSQGPCVAVVGSRSASAYGMTVTVDFCRDFCEAGFTVVTGGARGIDSVAAETSIKFGGKAALVLGCGIDIAYPPENEELFRKVVENGGAVVSEFIYGTQPLSSLFPQRNRIIAALSDCCVVTEAGLRSGALITAEHCLDLRRPVYAVPGNITSAGSAGTNGLIRSGAIMATSGMQIAADLRLILSFLDKDSSEPSEEPSIRSPKSVQKIKEPAAGKKISGLAPDEEKIISAIRDGFSSPEEISRSSGLNEAVLAPLLVMLELKGVVERLFGGKYIIKNGPTGRKNRS